MGFEQVSFRLKAWKHMNAFINRTCHCLFDRLTFPFHLATPLVYFHVPAMLTSSHHVMMKRTAVGRQGSPSRGKQLSQSIRIAGTNTLRSVCKMPYQDVRLISRVEGLQEGKPSEPAVCEVVSFPAEFASGSQDWATSLPSFSRTAAGHVARLLTF